MNFERGFIARDSIRSPRPPGGAAAPGAETSADPLDNARGIQSRRWQGLGSVGARLSAGGTKLPLPDFFRSENGTNKKTALLSLWSHKDFSLLFAFSAQQQQATSDTTKLGKAAAGAPLHGWPKVSLFTHGNSTDGESLPSALLLTSSTYTSFLVLSADQVVPKKQKSSISPVRKTRQDFNSAVVESFLATALEHTAAGCAAS